LGGAVVSSHPYFEIAASAEVSGLCCGLTAKPARQLRQLLRERVSEMSENNPTVWADGFGKWHASVPITTPRAQAALARKLIRAEMDARDVSPQYVLRVTRERITNHGTVIYGEVWL
jgi:hypothetical protein